jgi:tetratricopeptide (TPR) repeat protein
LAAFHEDTVDRDEAMAECETACRAALALEPGGANAQKCRRTLQMLRDDAEYVPVPAGDLSAHCAGDDALLCRDTAAKHKAAGGGDFSLSDFAGAAKHYSTALAFDWTDHVLYSNRSACLAALKEYDGALRDGRRCVRLQPDWPKGHGRCAAALLGKGDVPGAQAAAERGLELDATNANLIAVRDACLARCLEDAAIGA